MVEYNVGDKVKYIGDIMSDLSKDKIYVIIETDNGDNEPIKVIDDGGYHTWLCENDFEIVDEIPVLHPLFDEWYDMFKERYSLEEHAKSKIIIAIHQMGWGHGLEDPNGVKISDPTGGGKWNALWNDVRMNKEKYTRAILDDNYVLDKPKRWVLKLNDKSYYASGGVLTDDKEQASKFKYKDNAEEYADSFGGTIEEV